MRPKAELLQKSQVFLMLGRRAKSPMKSILRSAGGMLISIPTISVAARRLAAHSNTESAIFAQILD
jgi:hypothetical protein